MFYTKKNEHTTVILLVHVDDITIIILSINTINTIKDSLQSYVEITDSSKLY